MHWVLAVVILRVPGVVLWRVVCVVVAVRELSMHVHRAGGVARATPPVGSVGRAFLRVVGLSCLLRLEYARLSAPEKAVAVFQWDVVRGAVERLKRADEVLASRA
eukprot:5157607-Pyramimonas_sp.AAC.1